MLELRLDARHVGYTVVIGSTGNEIGCSRCRLYSSVRYCWNRDLMLGMSDIQYCKAVLELRLDARHVGYTVV